MIRYLQIFRFIPVEEHFDHVPQMKIMKIRHILSLLGAAFVFCACIPSLNPFYTPKDIVTDARLVHTWKNSGDGETVWQFEKTETNTYTLHVTEKGEKKGELTAVLFKIDKDYFLDVIPNNCDFSSSQADIIGASMFPGHLLIHVSQFEPTLKTALMDFDWLANTLEKNPKLIETHKEGKGIVLTASTSKLQKFVRNHMKELFPKEEEWKTPSAGK
jgi:hypothetical protein